MRILAGMSRIPPPAGSVKKVDAAQGHMVRLLLHYCSGNNCVMFVNVLCCQIFAVKGWRRSRLETPLHLQEMDLNWQPGCNV